MVAPDLPRLYDIATGSQRLQWRYKGPIPTPDEFAAGLTSSDVLTQLVVCEVRTREPRGYAVCYALNEAHRFASMGIIVDEELSGTGRGAEAGLIFLNYLFASFDIRKIYLEVPEYNLPQISSAIGRYYIQEGTLVKHFYAAGQYWDQVLLASHRDLHGAALAETARRLSV
jgi:RimJ/RimL family protein N-acetyltransferase